MMPCQYLALDKSDRVFDLDQVIDVVKGHSGIRSEWTALVVYDPTAFTLIELRDSPPDFKGNSADEAEEVTEQYVCESFRVTADQLKKMRSAPREWQLINRRE